MGRVAKKYEELVITDDFMFGKVFRNPERCRKLLEIILGVRVRELVFIDGQKALNPDYDAKGIRMDVYMENAENTVYNVEMQVRADDSLPMRSRYYQSVIDINLLEKGAEYRKLRKSYLIFICAFDPFDKGRHIYHFGTFCLEDPSVRLMDGAERIFLNTKGTMEDVDGGLRNLLQYFGSLIPQDDFTRELEAAVMAAREHREWRQEYMKLTLWEQDIRYEARTEGREEGRAEGRAEGKAEGIVEGRAEGELINLINQIRRKIAKGKTPEAIAEDLDEELEKVKRVYDVVSRHSPDDDIEGILRELAEKA